MNSPTLAATGKMLLLVACVAIVAEAVVEMSRTDPLSAGLFAGAAIGWGLWMVGGD